MIERNDGPGSGSVGAGPVSERRDPDGSNPGSNTAGPDAAGPDVPATNADGLALTDTHVRSGERADTHGAPAPDGDAAALDTGSGSSPEAAVSTPSENTDEVSTSSRGDAAEGVERELVLLFRRARNVSANVAGHVHPDLDPASYSLLLMVADAGQLRGMDVADRIGLDKSTVSRQIATLVELDLLERVPDPDDGRARLIQLSQLGQERLAQLRGKRSEYLREVFASWPTSDLREFARLLGRLNDVV